MFKELIEYFQIWNPGLISMMKNCSHHYSCNDLNYYHVEDDVWTHTCLSYKNLVDLNIQYDNFSFVKYLTIAVLCHDIGKVYTRNSPSPGKIGMYEHAFASIQDTIDFIYYLKENTDFFETKEEFENSFYYVLTSISNHMDYMFNENKRSELTNNDLTLLCFCEILLNCDTYGTIKKNNRREFAILNGYTKLKQESDIVFYCGVPGSGKDYLAEKENRKIISFDDLRIKIFIDQNSGSFGDDLYHLAFKYCNEQKVDLNKYLIKEITDSFKNGYKKIAICNTNLTRKLRKQTINSIKNSKKLKNKTIGANYICCKKETYYKRDRNRDSKTIGKEIVNKFVYNQQIPIKSEGFDSVNFIDNEVTNNE